LDLIHLVQSTLLFSQSQIWFLCVFAYIEYGLLLSMPKLKGFVWNQITIIIFLECWLVIVLFSLCWDCSQEIQSSTWMRKLILLLLRSVCHIILLWNHFSWMHNQNWYLMLALGSAVINNLIKCLQYKCFSYKCLSINYFCNKRENKVK
jgi:hypothetical protein